MAGRASWLFGISGFALAILAQVQATDRLRDAGLPALFGVPLAAMALLWALASWLTKGRATWPLAWGILAGLATADFLFVLGRLARPAA